MSENKSENKDKAGRSEVSFDDLSYSNTLSIVALFRVLERKGIVKQREVVDELTVVKTEMSGQSKLPSNLAVTIIPITT